MSTSNQAPDASPKAATVWAGLDVSKATFDAGLFWPREDGLPRHLSEIPAAAFPRTRRGVNEFLTWLDERLPGAAPRAVMEATGKYSVELTQWLIAARPALAPAIINPGASSAFIKSLGLRNKTDRAEARALAVFGAERQPQPFVPLTPEMAALRDLTRYRQNIIELRVAEENRARETYTSATVRALLKRRIAQLRRDEKKIERELQTRLADLPELKRDVALLASIYGVGWLTALTVLVELGDLRRFDKARQLNASSGLSPRNHQSGTSVRRKTRLSKQGNGRVRKALFMPALTVIRGESDLADCYHRLIAAGKSHKTALCAVMRKLLIVMRAVLLSGAAYEKHHQRAGGQRVDKRWKACGKLTDQACKKESIYA